MFNHILKKYTSNFGSIFLILDPIFPILNYYYLNLRANFLIFESKFIILELYFVHFSIIFSSCLIDICTYFSDKSQTMSLAFEHMLGTFLLLLNLQTWERRTWQDFVPPLAIYDEKWRGMVGDIRWLLAGIGSGAYALEGLEKGKQWRRKENGQACCCGEAWRRSSSAGEDHEQNL